MHITRIPCTVHNIFFKHIFSKIKFFLYKLNIKPFATFCILKSIFSRNFLRKGKYCWKRTDSQEKERAKYFCKTVFTKYKFP